MAVLKRLIVGDFRNIALGQMDFSPNVNCICGGNGEGKTNLLDAIHYLSMTKSVFPSPDRFNIRYGCESFSLGGTYAMPEGVMAKFALSVNSSGEKKVLRDEKPFKKISDHIGLLPVVMIAPSDGAMVSESGEERRRFLNSVLSQMDRQYLADMQDYNRMLAQRNKLLKNETPDEGILDVFDEKMSEIAQRIYQSRQAFVEELVPVVATYYEALSGGKEKASIEYSSDVAKATLAETLRACREKDRLMRFTTAGIQRDDLKFLMDGYPIRRCGSQGQQKSFLVSLKFAQYELMKSSYGYAPMLLLDDVFDKLDMDRISNLLRLVAGRQFGQIFITDTDKTRLRRIVDEVTHDRAYFEAKGGCFTQIDRP